MVNRVFAKGGGKKEESRIQVLLYKTKENRGRGVHECSITQQDRLTEMGKKEVIHTSLGISFSRKETDVSCTDGMNYT